MVPEVASPSAKVRWPEKEEVMRAMAGFDKIPLPSPRQSPWASRMCQYLVARLVIMIPTTVNKEPTSSSSRTHPRS